MLEKNASLTKVEAGFCKELFLVYAVLMKIKQPQTEIEVGFIQRILTKQELC